MNLKVDNRFEEAGISIIESGTEYIDAGKVKKYLNLYSETRAKDILSQMEKAGVVSPEESFNRRKVLMGLDQFHELMKTVDVSPRQPSLDDLDSLFEEAGKAVIDYGRSEVGMLARTFDMDMDRASVIMDQLERSGVITPPTPLFFGRILMTQDEFALKIKEMKEPVPDLQSHATQKFNILFEQAGNLVIDTQKAYVGRIQLGLKVDRQKAEALMEQLESAGVVGPDKGSKPRDILMDQEQFQVLIHSGPKRNQKSLYDSMDPLFEKAGEEIIQHGKGSIGRLQRVFRIGFNHAFELMDQLETAGVVKRTDDQGMQLRQVTMNLEEFHQKIEQMKQEEKGKDSLAGEIHDSSLNKEKRMPEANQKSLHNPISDVGVVEKEDRTVLDIPEEFSRKDPGNSPVRQNTMNQSGGNHMEEKERVDFQDVVFGKEQDPMADYFEEHEKGGSSWKPETSPQEQNIPYQEGHSQKTSSQESDTSSEGSNKPLQEADNASKETGPKETEGSPKEAGDKPEDTQKETFQKTEEEVSQEPSSEESKEQNPGTKAKEPSSKTEPSRRPQSSGETAATYSEEYEDEVDRIVNGKMRNGLLGRIIGVVKGVVAVVAEIAGTAIRRFLFGERGTVDIKKTYQQYQQAEDMKQEVKKQKEERSREQTRETSREETKTQSGEQRNPEEKTEEPSREKAADSRKTDEKIVCAADLNPMSAEERQDITEQVLQHREVQELFKQYGYFAVSNEEGIGIHQNLKDAIGVTNFVASKEELLTGDAWSLTTAILATDQIGKPDLETQGDSMKLDAALKASLLTSSLLYQLHSEQIQEALANEQSVELSHTNFISENGVSKINVVVSPRKDGPQAGLYYNRKYIGPVPCEMLEGVSPLQRQVYPSLSEKLNRQYHMERNQTFSFGSEVRSIQFTRTEKDAATVTMIKDGEETELGTFSFKSEQGVHDLAKALKDHDWNLSRLEQKNLIDKANARTAAYTVASVINPSMAAVIGRDNQYRSVVTGKFEDPGAGYLHAERTEERITVYKNIPDPKKGMVTQPVYQFDSIENLDVNELAMKIHKASNEIRHTETVVDGYARKFRGKEIDCGVRKCSSIEALQSVQGYSTMQIVDGNPSYRIVDRTSPHIPTFNDAEPSVKETEEKPNIEEKPDMSFVADVELDEEEFHCSGDVSEDEMFEEVPEEYSLD